jgi:hypothetical protein
MARARASCPEGPAEARVGETLLTAVSEAGGSLWVLTQASDPGTIGFGVEAERAWRHAAAALPEALPFLWSSVRSARDRGRRAAPLGALARQGAVAVRENLLDGPSFGLPFLLALASLVLERPVPPDVAASGVVEPDGSVLPVARIDEKILVLACLAPRVGRVLVAPADEEAARAAAREAGTDLEIRAVATAAEALQEAFGDELASWGTRAGQDSSARPRIVASLFRLALSGRSHAVSWRPVEAAARAALDGWPDLADGDRRTLEFVAAVAARHDRNAGTLAEPDPEWLQAMPALLRIEVVAHFVQQSADTGTPDVASAERLARQHLPPACEAHAGQLRLMGALGRLRSVTGSPREALALQQTVAETFERAFRYGDMSYALCECFRLAGALGDEEAFERAEALRARAASAGALGSEDDPYVEVARLTAMTRLGRHEGTEAGLQRLLDERSLLPWLRGRALRTKARLLAARGSPGAASAFEVGPACQALIRLDRAVERRDAIVAEEALAALGRLHAGLVAHLRAAAGGGDPSAYLARFFPY